MSRKSWAMIGPSLVLAGGILVSTALAAAGSRWLIAAGILAMIFFTLGADMFQGRLRGRSMMMSSSAILMSAAFLVACGMVAMKNPALVAMLIPVLGSGVAVPILLVRKSC